MCGYGCIWMTNTHNIDGGRGRYVWEYVVGDTNPGEVRASEVRVDVVRAGEI